MSRLLAFVALAALAAFVVGETPAAAKEGVVARVLTPIPRTSESGTKLRVVWTLSFVEDGQRRLFTAEGVFVRLFGPDGSRSRRVYAFQPTPGRYRATVTVPRGGVRKVVIGLMGTACDSAGCRSAPALFPVVGNVFR